MGLILDLSFPFGGSVNAGIPIELFSVKYPSFDYAIDLVNAFGQGCHMAKVDIRHAFRICPVHLDDWPICSGLPGIISPFSMLFCHLVVSVFSLYFQLLR